MELNPLGRWTAKIATSSRRHSEGREGTKENQQSADNLDGNRRPA
jgi:hypothetical protein